MPQLELVFLGTGTSQGVPMIACDCRVCRSDDPRDNRTRSSLYVAAPERAFVIDTGAEFRVQCLREGISRIDAVVYTHSHTDHIMGFDDLRRFSNGQPLPIYAAPEHLADIRRAFNFAFNGENRFPGYIHPEPHPVTGVFRIGDTEITPLAVPHGRMTVNGYLFSRGGRERAAYFSDCKDIPREVRERLWGVPVLILDALRFEPHPTHLSIPEAIEVAREIEPGQTWFTHLTHDILHAEVDPELPEEIGLAYDGLRITC